jgi:UrcA family protein
MKTIIKSMTSVIASSVVTLGCMGFATSSQAAEPGEALTKIVAYGDLNLDSDQGAKVLYARLRTAARSVCSPFESRELTAELIWQTCFDHAVSAAVTQINKNKVTALHNRTIGGSIAG